MLQQTHLAGTFTLPGTSITLNRMGYGAMQLAGPLADHDGAIAVLRDVVKLGITHIDDVKAAKSASTSERATTSAE